VAYGEQVSCEEAGGLWTAYVPERYPPERYPGSVLPPGETIKGYCDQDYTCRNLYEAERSVYNRNVFIALVVLGAISLGLGFVLTTVSAVSSGLMFGGILSLFIGTVRYWSGMDEYIRLIVLGIVLVSLIVLGYKRLKDN